MKRNMLKGVCATASLLVGMVSASPALADRRDDAAAKGVGAKAQLLTGSLGNAASAKDVYVAVCPDGKTGLLVDVNDLLPNNPAAVCLDVFKDNAATHTCDNDGGGIGPTVALNKGDGVYNLLFAKSAVGAEGYDSLIGCLPGDTNPSTIQRIQNQ